MVRFICYINMILLLSCGSKFNATEEYVYNSKGFSSTLSVALLIDIDSLDLNGVPVNSNKLIRVDLHRSGSVTQKKIYFFKKNEGYYWRIFLSDEKSDTLPINFEKGHWYAVWGGNMESGLFNENYHSFFLYVDSIGKVNVHERVIQDNL